MLTQHFNNTFTSPGYNPEFAAGIAAGKVVGGRLFHAKVAEHAIKYDPIPASDSQSWINGYVSGRVAGWRAARELAEEASRHENCARASREALLGGRLPAPLPDVKPSTSSSGISRAGTFPPAGSAANSPHGRVSSSASRRQGSLPLPSTGQPGGAATPAQARAMRRLREEEEKRKKCLQNLLSRSTG